MDKLSYCLECKRIFNSGTECGYCKSGSVKELGRNSPVNIIGTKLKGRVLKSKDGVAQLLFEGAKRVKSIKEFEVCKLKKIL